MCGSRNLKQLTLPEGLESIGAGAFARCDALEEVVIPESVTEIGPSAFAKCTALHRVQMSNTLAGKLDGSVFMMTPFAQNQHPLNALPLFNETLVVGLGDDVNNRALLAFADVMDGEQDLLCMSIYAGRLELAAISFHECILAKEKQGAFRSKFYTIQIGKKLCRDMPKNIFPNSGTPALRDEEPEVRRILARYRFVIVAVRIGDIEGSGVPLLAQWLREMEIPHIVLAVMPFAFDDRVEEAAVVHKALTGSPCIDIDCEQRNKESPNPVEFTRQSCFDIANAEIIREIQNILTKRKKQV